MAEPKKIYCPLCKRKVAHWDRKSKIDVICKCKKCNIRVVYHVANGVTEAKKIPPREQSSGLNFSY